MDNPGPFKVRTSAVFKTLVFTPSSGWIIWTVLAIGIAFLAAGCFGDIRFLIVGLIVCLTFIPVMSFFIFAGYMSSSKRVANLLPHTVERIEDGYLIRIFRHADKGEEGEDENIWIETGRISLSDSNVVRKETTPDYEVVLFRDSNPGILYIPRF